MTVYIEKPAANLREELASLRNQGGYQEQQFYFDGLVTNGTFDVDTSGWNPSASTLSAVSGRLRITNTGAYGAANASITTEVGKVYQVSVTSFNGTAGNNSWRLGTTNGGSDIYNRAASSSEGTDTAIFVATTTTVYFRLYAWTTTVGQYSEYDNVSVFEVDANDDVIHTMPKGWKPKDVFEDGLLQREGAAHDYEVVYDGFDYYVKPTVAPSAITQTCVIGVKA